MKNKKIESISLALKPTATADFYSIIPHLVQWLNKRKIKINFLESEEKRVLKFLKNKSFNYLHYLLEDDFYNSSDLIISLGGDGTLIGTCRRINKNIPILGINLGRLGFITEFNKEEMYDILSSVIEGNVTYTKNEMYLVKVTRNKKVIFKEYFFNDIVCAKSDIARMISLRTEVNNNTLLNISGDGLIISTAFGSTAYSMAAGGPIVHPKVNGLVLTPICPHSLNHRPIIIPTKVSVLIRMIPPYGKVNLTVDGQVVFGLSEDDIIEINTTKTKNIRLVKNPSRNYFDTLKEKFLNR